MSNPQLAQLVVLKQIAHFYQQIQFEDDLSHDLRLTPESLAFFDSTREYLPMLKDRALTEFEARTLLTTIIFLVQIKCAKQFKERYGEVMKALETSKPNRAK